MPLYDCGAEDCEECQIAFRGVKRKAVVTRDWLIDLIRTKYDPEPNDWPRHRGWDDGAAEIADIILDRARGAQQPIATVINNNQPGWTNIIETAPGVTLDIGAELFAASIPAPVGGVVK